jgi:outer membrane protein insertion porin family
VLAAAALLAPAASAQALPGITADSAAVGAPAPAVRDTAEAVRVVGTVSVEGNTYTDSARIVRTFDLPPGSRYSTDAVRRGLRKLFTLGLFEDVEVDERPRGTVVDLVIRVVERSRIGKIEFTGNRKRETAELEKKLFLRVGDSYSPVQVQAQVDSLLDYYRQEGWARATVRAETDTMPNSRQVALRFAIQEGEKVRITDIDFEGARAFSERRLRKTLKTKAKGLFGGGSIEDESFQEDRERLEAHYHDHGYRDARVTGFQLKPGGKPRDLTLTFTVDEGPRYRIGEIAWTGNTVVDDATLRRVWQPKPDDLYDQSRIQRAQAQAVADYAERGYLYLNIEPRETVRADTVDVTFVVTEGRPSNVRMVHIAGNRATREKVIRRELDVHEGDRFKRSALVRSQGDLMRLGFFENVDIDFQPADSTDIDLIFKVKEKSVGTASAGAGYTAESGLTGFVELGHNNVLGNGQTLSLHLERGARRSDYFLSFTEPWFRDTPTLLGFSLFNTERERDLFDEKRVGGSVRLGRPLPWPDYSRGSISYRLEDVTIEIDRDNLTEQDLIVLEGVESGEAVRTSSLGLNFSRNSTDNPFYPTKGSRFTLEHELAGGPFGGSVNFHKHRVEGRGYFPSLLKGVTTMLRGRIGLLDRYPDQNSGLPPYERFRLGGGTTPDPLRGYDDYMVVPKQFIRDVPIYQGFTTSDYQRVRYPGGRYMTLLTVEQQFPIAHPLHGVLFLDAGNTWDTLHEIRPFDLKVGAGIGMRLEIPLLGNIGFDYGYGFHRDDKPQWTGHFLIGQTSF